MGKLLMGWAMVRQSTLALAILGLVACRQQAPEPVALELPPPSVVVPALEPPEEVQSVELKADEFYSAAAPSVVLVTNPEANSMGSGVEIERGIFVTNCHVLAGGTRFAIERNGRKVPAFVYRTAPERDTCLLLAKDRESHPAPTRSATTLRVGEGVFALGNPQGFELTLSEGIVSQLRATSSKEPLVQTTAAISQGSSGGGLFDKAGNLIGISTFMHKYGQNLNFAVPIDWALQLAESNAVPQSLASQEDAAQTEEEPEVEQLDPRQLNEQAVVLIGEDRFSEAVPLLTAAAELAPTDAEIAGNLGYALLEVGRHEDAKEKLKAALKLAPKRATTWLNLGQAYSALGDKDLAVRSLVNGYQLSSRKQAIRDALARAADDPEVSDSWKETAATALVAIDAPP